MQVTACYDEDAYEVADTKKKEKKQKQSNKTKQIKIKNQNHFF